VNDFGQVGAFHHKFGLQSVTNSPTHVTPKLLDYGTANFRIKFLSEELAEFAAAVIEEDMPGIADALVDLVYVALGTAHMYGLPWDALFAEVQRANMTKVRAANASESKRGSALDVVKPPGWTPPDIAGVLKEHLWEDERETELIEFGTGVLGAGLKDKLENDDDEGE